MKQIDFEIDENAYFNNLSVFILVKLLIKSFFKRG